MTIRSLFVFIIGLSLLIGGCGGGGGGSGAGVENTTTKSNLSTVPTGLTATVVSSTQIDLTWNASSDNTGIGAYTLYQGTNVSSSYFTHASFLDLTPGQQYCFAVSATDLNGNQSSLTTAVCASTPPSASSWVTVRKGTDINLTTAIWTGTKLVVGGDDYSNPLVLTSSDGRAWTQTAQVGFGYTTWKGMIYTGSKFVAFNSTSSIFTSNDGISWTASSTIPHDSSTNVAAMAWSSGHGYVTVGGGGKIFTSPDLTQWTLRDSGTTESLLGVRWINGRFIAVGKGTTVLTSADGITWSKATTPALVSYNDFYDVAWNGKTDPGQSRYIATGLSSTLLSSDGLTWTAAASATMSTLASVVWADSLNLFAAVGPSGAVFTSPDGENWTRRFLSAAPYYVTNGFNRVVWTGARFVAVGEMGTVIYSSDGVTWTIATSGNDFRSVAWNGSQFIAVGSHGRMAVASNATDWTYRYLGSDYPSLYDLAWSGTRYLAVGFGGVYSTDLVSWVSRQENSVNDSVVYAGGNFVKTETYGILTWDGVTTHAGTTDPYWKWSFFNNVSPYPQLHDVLWTGSQFVTVGGNGRIYTSPDATETSVWTLQSSNVTQGLNAVVWSGTLYVAVGDSGVVITSPDAQTWTTRASSSTDRLNDIVWTGTKFIAIGNAGTILTSTNGIAWSKEKAPDGYYLNGICWSGTVAVIVGDNGLIIRSN